MPDIPMLRQQLHHLISYAQHDLYALSQTLEASYQTPILQRLWHTVSHIHYVNEQLAHQALALQQQSIPPTYFPIYNQIPSQIEQRTFTIEELATYNGKNGKAAYVAVNGTVYDVTSNRAWAAATHFGLVAGKDYTKEFASCHAGQQSILTTMPVVGRLA